MLAGYSKIVRLGPEKIYAGGTTIAAQEVEIMISVIVERAQEGIPMGHMIVGRKRIIMLIEWGLIEC